MPLLLLVALGEQQRRAVAAVAPVNLRLGATGAAPNGGPRRWPGLAGTDGTGKPVSRAGAPYAIVWTAVVGARAVFSYGLAHWFEAPVVSWAIANHVSVAALTDGLVFMAIVMVLVRTFALGVRASRLPDAAADRAPVLAG